MKSRPHVLRRPDSWSSSLPGLRSEGIRGLCKSRLFVVGFVVILLCQLNLPGQDHHSASGIVIDGSRHPELISDIAAYRLFFLTVGQASESDSARQNAFLRAGGLDDEDIQAAIPVITKFAIAYQDTISTYNQTIESSNARGEDVSVVGTDVAALKTLVDKRDALVQTTRTALASAITSQGMTALDSYIKAEKRSMTVVEDAQP